jgi:hypothetical protein
MSALIGGNTSKFGAQSVGQSVCLRQVVRRKPAAAHVLEDELPPDVDCQLPPEDLCVIASHQVWASFLKGVEHVEAIIG